MEIAIVLKSRPKSVKFNTYTVTVSFARDPITVLDYPADTSFNNLICDVKMLILHRDSQQACPFYMHAYEAEIDSWVYDTGQWDVYSFIERMTGDMDNTLLDRITDIQIVYWDDDGEGEECEVIAWK